MSSTTDNTPTDSGADAAVDAPVSFDSRIDALICTLGTIVTEIKSLQKEAKDMKKDYTKEVKAIMKNTKKKTPMTEEQKKKSSFSKPLVLSSDLKTFLSLDADAMLSRTDITKLMNGYIRENELLNPHNKREINVWGSTTAGKALNKLLGPSTGDTITWFNLQKYLQKHYPKQTPAAVPPVAVVEPVSEPQTSKPKPIVKRVKTARVRAATTKA